MRWISRGSNKQAREEQERIARQQEERNRLARDRDRLVREKEDLVRGIRRELESAVHRRNEEGLEFVCEEDVIKVWTNQRIEMLSYGLGWSDIWLVQQKYKKILSILVYMHFEAWDQFSRIFLAARDPHGNRNLTDEHLPFGPTVQFFNDEHAHYKPTFLTRQYVFLPVVLVKETRYTSNFPEYSRSYRLPSLKSEPIGIGGSGVVTREYIAPGYFEFEQGPTTKPFWVAMKTIPRGDGPGSRDVHAEQAALRAFKQCLNKNENVMHSYTSFTHGSNFVIISPLADLDLHKFFEGKYYGFETRQQHFTPLHLLREASCLAGALHVLHYQLKSREMTMACAHLDFKPENVLVRWSPNGDSMPAGQWLVHDFGTSKIKGKEHHEDPNTLAATAPGDFIVSFSLTKVKRPPGPFQAPEVQTTQERVVGRETDMWSYGCLLAVVLAFALGGPDFVSELAHSRYDPDVPDHLRNDYFYTVDDDGLFILKPKVVAWLQVHRSMAPHRKWIGKTIDLIFALLKVDQTDRLTALEAQTELDVICSEHEAFMGQKCSWIKSEAPIFVESSRPTGLVNDSERSFARPRPSREQTGNSSIPPRSWATNDTSSSNLYPPESPPQAASSRQSFASFDRLSSPRTSSAHTQPSPAQSSQAQNGYFRERNPSINRVTTDGIIPIFTPQPQPSSPPDRSSRSDENSSTGQESSISADVTVVHVTSPNGAFKNFICPDSHRIACLSKSLLCIPNFDIQTQWMPKKSFLSSGRLPKGGFDPQRLPCPERFEWDMISLYGDWAVLRARGLTESKFIRYHCFSREVERRHIEIWDEDPFSTTLTGIPAAHAVNEEAKKVVELNINYAGDVLFAFDSSLAFYSSNWGYHSLKIQGQLLGAKFSSDGKYVFAWTFRKDRQRNIFYIWDAQTSKPVGEPVRSYRPNTPRPGSGINGLIFPFLTYFAAFEIPNRLYIIGKDAIRETFMDPFQPANGGTESQIPVIQLRTPIDDVVAGATYDISQAQGLVLVQKNTSRLKITHIPILAGNAQSSMPSGSQKVNEFDPVKDAIGVVSDDRGEGYVIISHPDGLVERRKLGKVFS